MTDDDKLATVFRRLREEEITAAPPFRSLSRPRTAARPHHGVLKLAGLAAGAFTILVVAVIVLGPAREKASLDSVVESTSLLDDVRLASTHGMPTDFLLDTPGWELASTTPQFRLSTPLYETPEERHDAS